jgi:uncharacterized protein YjbJ (UPF0337 family)
MSESKEKIEGRLGKTKGSIKEAVGAVTGNKKLESAGKKDRLKGGAEEAKADWKHAIKEKVDKI